ncbi:uncharacterized protein TNCT_103931 [Trichonephila clavata]|uniref:Uncharacterized protein n=1 Tax=Trichonephila clavata TaxID=2740835 RepID=A0A8X6KQT7_TRICU|nr:uncharacterized protein TNCT_103931 [Trichonephila clavata]
MIRLSVQILVLSVIAVSSVTALKGYSDEFLNFNVKTDICVSSSGDQDRCDSLLACEKVFPKPLDDTFRSCIRDTYPSGDLNKCNKTSNLYGTSEQFQSLLQCFLNKFPAKSTLSDDEKKEFKKYKKCIHKVGKKCFKERGFKS